MGDGVKKENKCEVLGQTGQVCDALDKGRTTRLEAVLGEGRVRCRLELEHTHYCIENV